MTKKGQSLSWWFTDEKKDEEKKDSNKEKMANGEKTEEGSKPGGGGGDETNKVTEKLEELTVKEKNEDKTKEDKKDDTAKEEAKTEEAKTEEANWWWPWRDTLQAHLWWLVVCCSLGYSEMNLSDLKLFHAEALRKFYQAPVYLS